MSIAAIRERLETYINDRGFTWQQVRDATRIQWYNHAVLAGFTPQQLRQFSGGKSVLRSSIIKRMKRAIVIAQSTALLEHVRLFGPDEETFPLIRDVIEHPEDY